MNYGLALGLFVLAIALIVIGWRGTYGNAWQLVTGRTTTFGGTQSSQGSSFGNVAATGARDATSAANAAGAGASDIAQQIIAALRSMGYNPSAAAAQSSQPGAGAVLGFQP